jgi:putative ABC transport system permease protein
VFDEFVQDLRYGVRTLLKAPAFAAVAILTLALGIGANSAIFSFVDAAMLKPLPYAEPERILQIWEKPPGGGNNVVSALNFLDWQKQSTSFEAMVASTGGSLTMTGQGDPVLLRAGRVSAGYFEVFRVAPLLGRTFAPDEDTPGKEHVIVLSHRLWATQFGSDPGIVGKAITLNAEPYTVIGVMPANSPFDRAFNQLWRPLAFSTSERTRNFHWLSIVGRLKPTATFEQARSELDAIGARIATDYPDSNKGWGVSTLRYIDIVVGQQLQTSLYVLLAAVGMLLLIGCANVANLVLARGTSREREVAVRAALGAGRGRLIRQFLTENVLLATIGGVLGIGLGYGLMIWLKYMLPPFYLPSAINVEMDLRVLAFTFALAVLTGVVFGLAPALSATKPDLAGAMKEGGRGAAGDSGRRRLRNALIVIEVALAFILLTSGGLLVRSFFRMMDVELGFNPTNVLTLRLPIAGDRFEDPAQLSAYVRQMVTRINAVPGVMGAASGNGLPFEGFSNGMPFLIAGRDQVDRANRQACGFKNVDPNYFKVLGIQITKGRGLTDRDVKGAPPVAVINTSMAKRFFENQDPIGQHLLIQEIIPGKPQLGPEIPWEIVGVIADERTAVEPASLSKSIIQAVHEIDRDQVVSDVRTLDEIKATSASSTRLRTTLLAVFAALALLLSAIGIYGVISYTVAQRTHEIGLRAALGATGGTLLRMVIANGMTLTLVGLALGFAGALWLTKLLATLLFNVGARDPITLVGSAVILAAVAFAACYLPARRAARMDPLVALREM